MVYNVTFAPLENFSVTTEDRNTRKSLGDRDEVACITYPKYDPGGTTNPLIVRNITLRNIEFEERQID